MKMSEKAAARVPKGTQTGISMSGNDATKRKRSVAYEDKISMKKIFPGTYLTLTQMHNYSCAGSEEPRNQTTTPTGS